jgi:large-conductance mechanosensitive channel
LRDVVTFLVVALFIFAFIAVGWLMIGSGVDRKEQKHAQRRSEAERRLAVEARDKERVRRLDRQKDDRPDAM